MDKSTKSTKSNPFIVFVHKSTGMRVSVNRFGDEAWRIKAHRTNDWWIEQD